MTRPRPLFLASMARLHCGETADAAQRFIGLAADIGWAGAQEIRDASGGSDTAIPTLATWLERHLDELASSATPGTIDGYRREAARTWLPRLGRVPLDMLTRERITSWVAWQRKQETARSARARAKAIAAGVVTLASANAFGNSGITATTGDIYVPDALVDTYKTATNWSTFANRIQPLSAYTP